MFNLIRVGKEWAGPVFPHPLKSKGYMCIHDRVRLAVFFCRQFTLSTTVFSHLLTFCMRLMFYLLRVRKEWASLVFPHSLTRNFRFCAYSWQGKFGFVFLQMINHWHNSFPPPDNLLNKVDVLSCQVGKEWAGFRVGKEWADPVFPHPLTSNFMFYAYSGQGNLRLAEVFPIPLTI